MIAAASRIIAAVIIVGGLLYLSSPPVHIEQIAMQVSENVECAFIVSSAGGIESMICDAVGDLDISHARWIGGGR
jgi:hypothetical protein